MHPILIDMGCSVTCTGFKEAFAGQLVCGDFGSIKMANGAATIEEFSMAHWHTVTEEGEPVMVQVPAYYVPSIELQLFSPQDYSHYHKQDPHLMTMFGSQSWFMFHHESTDPAGTMCLI